MQPFKNFPYVAIDVETYGLKWWLPDEGIFGIAISYPDGSDHYFDIRRQPNGIQWLREQKPNRIVNHNIKFDLHMLHNLGVTYDPKICECTMVRANLIDEHIEGYSLDRLATKYLGDNKKDDIYPKLAELYGGAATRNVQIKNLHRANAEMVAPYAKKDTRLALRLWEWQEEEIERQGLRCIVDFEQKLFPCVFDMERKGVCVDEAKAHSAAGKLTIEIDLLKEKLNSEAGFECNPNPSGDIHKLFKPIKNSDDMWEAIDGTILTNTPTGKPCINTEALRNMQHPTASLIVKIRKITRCRDTFLKGHILGHSHNGLLHPNINQVKGDQGGTGTGRLSYTQPALQQIPARDKEIASILRPLFLPDEDYVWCCWDYDQFEYRMFSHYVNEPKILDIYKNDPKFDYHQMVADLTGLPRNAPVSGGANAKQLNLSMIYDMGEASICRTLGLPLDPEMYSFVDREGKTVTYQKAGEAAKNIIEKYHNAIPGVRQLYDSVKAIGKSRGYIRSIAGRHMRYPHGYRLNKAKAILCQGSSADCMKQKMIEIFDFFQSEHPDCRMYLSVHDEINLGVPKKHPKLRGIIRTVKNILEDYSSESCPIKLRVPIRTDFGMGYSWAEASGKGA